MSNTQARWIWYPGDIELFYALKQNFSRVERGCAWPAFWKSDSFRQRVTYRRTYRLSEATSFQAIGAKDTVGYVLVNDKKYPLGSLVTCGPGPVQISIHAACISCLPAVYISGDVVCSDEGWTAEDYCQPPVPAAGNRYFLHPDQPIDVWPMLEQIYAPVISETVNGGVLYGFETELTAQLEATPLQPIKKPLTAYLGESREEALAGDLCYYFCKLDPITNFSPRQAMRYVFLPGIRPEEVTVRAHHQYVDIPVRAHFRCDDEECQRAR